MSHDQSTIIIPGDKNVFFFLFNFNQTKKEKKNYSIFLIEYKLIQHTFEDMKHAKKKHVCKAISK